MMPMMPFLLMELPSELVLHVLTRLPLKYLMRLRCVSKFFLALTNNPTFIASYRKSNPNPNPNPDFNFMDTTTTSTKERQWEWRFHMLFKGSNFIYLQKRHELIPFRCPTYMRLIGSTNGLICFDDPVSLEIYNIFAGTKYYIMSPIFSPPTWTPVSVFGYDPISNDYKILRIMDFYDWQIYSFRTNSWKIMTLVGWPYTTVYHNSDGGRTVCINGVIYWPPGNPEYPHSDKIVFFNLNKEKFGVIQLPKEDKALLLPTIQYAHIQLLSFRGSLAFALIDNRTSTTTSTSTRKRMRSGATRHGGGGGGEVWVELFIFCEREKENLWNRLSFVLPISPPPKEVEIMSCGNEIFLGWFQSDNQLLRLYNLFTKCIFDLPLSPPSHYYPKASFMEKEEDNPTYVDNLSFDFSLI